MIFYAYFFCCLSQNNYLCTLIFSLLQNMQSHPTWVRGLKLLLLSQRYLCYQSHPTWVRGLKLKLLIVFWLFLLSHPTWVRGLKLPFKVKVVRYLVRSHPTWVRGLKHSMECAKGAAYGRTLRGCVD